VTHAERNSVERRLAALGRIVNGAAFNVAIAVLILVSIALLFTEFLLPPGDELERVVFAGDLVTWIFVVELTLRFTAAPSKKTFFSNYWIDILAVLPVLRVFRTLRLIRLLRMLRLARAATILLRRSGWLSVRLERFLGHVGILLIATTMLILCGALAMLSETDPAASSGEALGDFFENLWLATFLFVSGEPVGTIPGTVTGHLVAITISVAGLVVFAVMVGAFSASMSTYLRTKMEDRDLSIDELRNHTLICGWDRMGGLILSELESVAHVWRQGVVVISETETDVVAASGVANPRRLFHVKDDFTKVSVLESVGARYAQAAIVLADKGQNLRDQDRDARTVLAALTLEKINPRIFTCAELLDEVNATHLHIAGVEEIVSRTTITAGLFTSTLVNRGITSVVSDLLTHKVGTCLRKIDVPGEFVGREFIDVFEHFKRQFDAIVLGLDRNGDDGKPDRVVNPPNSRTIRQGDKLIVVTGVHSSLGETG